MSDEIVVQDGNIYGTWHRARNFDIGMGDTIHSDEMAKKVGFRGGAVVGLYHLDLFPPLLLKAFGQRWFEQGSLSIYYTYALTDGEQLRAVVATPPAGEENVQVKAWLETPEGQTVGTGTASVGDPTEPSYLMSRELVDAEREDIRILADMKAGDPMPTEDVLITPEDAAKRIDTIHDPLDWHKGDSPWGDAILPLSSYYGAMSMGGPDHKYTQGAKAVSFFGATEIRHVNGPVKVGVPYRSGGKFACVGASPKTEFFWFDSYLEEKDGGNRVAEMRHLTRVMKASSALWQEG